MKTKTKHLKDPALVRDLDFHCLTNTEADDMFDAREASQIGKAHRALIRHGYTLAEPPSTEGGYYRQVFHSSDVRRPYKVTLRYPAGRTDGMPLALMFHEGKTVSQFIYGREGQNHVYQTDGRHARWMIKRFKKEHRNTAYFWMPIFPESPLAQP